jgi:hypothetical protein
LAHLFGVFSPSWSDARSNHSLAIPDRADQVFRAATPLVFEHNRVGVLLPLSQYNSPACHSKFALRCAFVVEAYKDVVTVA